TGSSAGGLALDPSRARLYVALENEDAIVVVDTLGGDVIDRFQLRQGDQPREVALTPDHRQLVVTNAGSASVVFIEPTNGLELGRVTVGEEPSALLIDRSGQRAYVLNVRSSTLSVVDIGTRAVVATLATDAQPRRAQLDRAGTSLYVIHAGSPNLLVVAVPAMTVTRRQYIGLGAASLRVDALTDLFYVGWDDLARLDVFHPSSLTPVDTIDVPAPVAYMTLDGLERTLVLVMPTAHATGILDLAGRHLLSAMDVGEAPRWVVLAGEQP
ncbi:MAG TPA: YncE family protein, partial [Acidimicrobiales bacterium]|nr:YncE family protein [Acidimicrobiales bacterium]